MIGRFSRFIEFTVGIKIGAREGAICLPLNGKVDWSFDVYSPHGLILLGSGTVLCGGGLNDVVGCWALGGLLVGDEVMSKRLLGPVAEVLHALRKINEVFLVGLVARTGVVQ